MSDRFEICVAFVLKWETEYNADGSVKVERDPRDPGGVTKFGIDQRDHPNVDVAHLTVAAAKEIYRAEEWTRCHCANVKLGWDMALFDSAVNIGAARAVKLAQQAVGVIVDGVIGPKTIGAINNAALDVLGDYLDLRESYYRALPGNLRSVYLQGWLNRLNDLREHVGVAKEVAA